MNRLKCLNVIHGTAFLKLLVLRNGWIRSKALEFNRLLATCFTDPGFYTCSQFYLFAVIHEQTVENWSRKKKVFHLCSSKMGAVLFFWRNTRQKTRWKQPSRIFACRLPLACPSGTRHCCSVCDLVAASPSPSPPRPSAIVLPPGPSLCVACWAAHSPTLHCAGTGQTSSYFHQVWRPPRVR